MSRARHVISSISSAREDFRRKELRNCTELWVGRICFQHTANMVVQSIVDAFRHNGLTFSFLLPTGVPWQFHAKRDLVVSCALHVCWVGMQMEGRSQASGGSSFLWFVAHRKSALLENKLYAWFRQYENTTYESAKTVYEQGSVHPYDPQRLLR